MNRNLLYCLVMCLIPLFGISQKTNRYEASNGKVYHVGDTIFLGQGSMPNGDFKFVEIGGWSAIMSYNSRAGSDQFNLHKAYSGIPVVVKKIKYLLLNGFVKVVFVIDGGNITNYNLWIEDAIATCEIKDCKKNEVQGTQPDKYDKLIKLKELFDSEIITKDEFETEKAKILNTE